MPQNIQDSDNAVFSQPGNVKLYQGLPNLIWPCTLQHFDKWACTPKISYDKKAEENNKNIFTNKHIIIFQQYYSPWATTGEKNERFPLGNSA